MKEERDGEGSIPEKGKKRVVLTGIKPTGMPHLGNYIGAIRPALALAQKEGVEARYFIADYHSLNTIREASVLRRCTREVAASWMAAGLEPERTLLYRQSDIPEVFELSTLLMAFTAKGLMNRAHAYKAAVDVNREKSLSDDHQVNMGLYTYPVLMAADILLFDSSVVPVGQDQVQHIEMAQDIAGVVNSNYGKELLVIPEARVSDDVLVPGLDGRKMSSSYGNFIPLFLPEKGLRKLVNRIVTNSQGVDEVKELETVFTLYTFFASEEECEALARRYRGGGMGWGEAKAMLLEKLNVVLGPMRERYESLSADWGYVDEVLREGACRARAIAARRMKVLRRAVGMG